MKRYFEAQYRIFDDEESFEYNSGYFCINEDSSIVGVFTFDIVYLNFCDDNMILTLYINDPDEEEDPIDFICNCAHFTPMSRYILVSDEIYLYLRIGKEIYNPTSNIKELFENLI